MRIARLRVRSVRMKNGGASVHVLRTATVTDAFEKAAASILEVRKNDMAGFAIVAWGRTGWSTTRVETVDGAAIPIVLVPDYVRSCVADYVQDLLRGSE
jgi:hypothetical protein